MAMTSHTFKGACTPARDDRAPTHIDHAIELVLSYDVSIHKRVNKS